MIVIYFCYIVCNNVLLYFNVFNFMCILISGPGCRAAAVTTTEDAYAYDEERIEVETFSPEVTDPVGPSFAGETRSFEKLPVVTEDIDKVDQFGAKKSANSSDLGTTSMPSSLVSLDRSNGTAEAAESITKICSSSSRSNETFELSTNATESTTIVTDATSADTSTKATESTATSSTETSTKATESETKSTNATCPDTSTKATESTTTPTTTFPDSSAKTNESAIVTTPHTSSLTNTSDLSTKQSTTQPFASDQINNTIELTTLSQIIASKLSPESPSTIADSPISEQTTTNATNSLDANVPLENDLPLPTILDVEEAKSLLETGIESLNENLKSTQPENVILPEEKALAPELTTPPPKYEEGYYDPKRAPTRYGQREEGIRTSQWQYVSDYGIGMRDYNLILYAVNNTAVLEKGSLLNYVYFVFREVLNVNMTLLDIRYCRYLNSKNQENTKKVPPVLVAFTRMEVKNEVLHKRKLLKPTNIKVEHDMPKKILDEQNALLKPLMDKYRAMGQYVVVRSGKLLVEGKVLTEIYLPEKYTYDPMQTFKSYVTTTMKTTTPGIAIPQDFMEFGYDNKKSGRKKKGGKGGGGGGKKKRKPMIRIPLDEEIGDELSVEVLFTTKKYLW